ncbi:FimV/HubP family polar landmark protein [Pseudoxanthomonas sp. CF125]|uniref:type IV pilus assembly protein FimV n=1 Tax=Pseudoxanthomonas sp. CF125 TaxID=1855303 RepID=UPI0008811F76|nr:pilus assembly protein FimV [Pseudoxanthomonas sp. CF125]
MKHGFLKLAPRLLLGVALILVSSGAMALGLGEIRVKSQPGQPLVAEIPVISTEPGELEQLQARLASPITFERVGLARPEGLVSGLNFAVAVSDEGKPVIRVTSTEPVQVAAVNFLIEVDWGQGRLVREYSALVDTPDALAAASQPTIDAPLPPPADTIIREPEPIAATEPAPAAEPIVPTPAPAEAAPAPRAPVAAPSPTLSSGSELEVQRGQTLSQIARDLGQGYSLDQTMLALLRANPEAFINGNINRLKQGAVLRVPQSAELAQLGEAEAAALVRDQMAEWRQARRPIPQPVETASPLASAPSRAAPAAPRTAEARLEIAPPDAGAATRAGTQSGIDAEGEGDMLANQQLTLTKEELAARESEVQELRAQVAELESLKQQQAKLIAMKDSELAAAQQRLAKSQGDASQPLWLWAGLGLLVAGLVVAWLINRRKKPVIAAARAGYDSAAMAAAMPAAEPATQAASQSKADRFDAPLYEDGVPAALPETQDEPVRAPAPPAAAPQTWTTAAIKPTWHTGEGLNVAPLNAAPAGRERLELAIAYLDLGDLETARDLLNEVVAGGDAAARNEATQLLREIG